MVMRIGTWNCYSELSWPNVTALDVDVVTIQECRPDTPDLVAQQDGWTCEYQAGRWGRGIAVLARHPYRIDRREAGHPWSISSTLITGPSEFRFVGFWAMTPKDVGLEYVDQAARVIEDLPLDGIPTVVAGDFNAESNPGHMANSQALMEIGLTSAYHRFNGEFHGRETRGTRFHEWNRDKPFYIDFVFIPREWQIEDVDVGDFDDYCSTQISDHVPVVVTVGDSAGSV